MKIIVITIIIALIYIGFTVFIAKKIKSIWIVVTINTLLTAILLPVCTNLLAPIFNREERRLEEQFRRVVIDGLINQSLNRSEIENLIIMKRKEIFQSTEEEARKFVRNLIGHEGKKKKEISALRDKTKILSDKLHLQWKPITKYILDVFDQRIVEIKKYNEEVEFKKYINDIDLVVDLDIKPYTETEIRKVDFPSGSSLSIGLGAGQVQQGVFLGDLNMVFKEVPPPHIRDTVAFVVRCFDSYSAIVTENNRYKDIYFKTGKDPLDDEEFISKINIAINQLITNIYLY